MLERWIKSLLVSFVMRQIVKFKDAINWDMVKADLSQRVRDLVPGSFFDDEAVAVVVALLDRAKAVLTNSRALEAILNHAANEEWDQAWAKLKALLLDGWMPVTAEEQRAMALVASVDEADFASAA